MVNEKITSYSDREPPRVVKRKPISHPWRRGATAGYIVYCHARQTPAYLSKRVRDKNLFRKFDSYPISEEILNQFEGTNLSRVYIAEDPTGNVYEYSLDQYLSAPTYEWEVENNQGEVVKQDIQRCPAREDARYVWENHASDLFHSPV